MGIYNTLLTSEYSSQGEDNIHPRKQEQRNRQPFQQHNETAMHSPLWHKLK